MHLADALSKVTYSECIQVIIFLSVLLIHNIIIYVFIHVVNNLFISIAIELKNLIYSLVFSVFDKYNGVK